jgi:hypothetical protein
MAELVLPLSSTGRKYGYVTWSKGQEPDVRRLLREAGDIDVLLPGGATKRKHVDWKHHRLSVGYKATRNLPTTAQSVRLRMHADGSLEISFE